MSLPAEAAPATDDIAVADPEHPVDAVDLGAEDLQDAEDDVSAAADQEPAGANLHAEHLHHTGADGSEGADREPGGAPKCAYCTMEFYSSDERVMIHGRLYHADLCPSSPSRRSPSLRRRRRSARAVFLGATALPRNTMLM